ATMAQGDGRPKSVLKRPKGKELDLDILSLGQIAKRALLPGPLFSQLEVKFLGQALLRRSAAVRNDICKISLLLTVLEPWPRRGAVRKSPLGRPEGKRQVSAPLLGQWESSSWRGATSAEHGSKKRHLQNLTFTHCFRIPRKP